ncbi:MAG TPA: hypothetical protein VGM67_19825 [Gemmatimonadaceae bacterium]
MKRLFFLSAAIIAVAVAACQQDVTKPGWAPSSRAAHDYRHGSDNTSPYGMVIGSFSNVNSALDMNHSQALKMIHLMKEAGVTWVKLESQWNLDLSGTSTYNDSLTWPIQTLADSGLQVFVDITHFPYPTDSTTWVNYIKHYVDTYGGLGVRYWEIGNESEVNYGGTAADLAHLTQLAASIIHSGNGNSAHDGWVVGPAVMYGTTDFDAYTSSFMSNVGDSLDIGSFHVYTDNPDGVRNGFNEFSAYSGTRPVWVTEENAQEPDSSDCFGFSACDSISAGSILGALSQQSTTFISQRGKVFVFSALPSVNNLGVFLRVSPDSFARTKAFYAYKTVANPGGCVGDTNCYQPIYAWWARGDVMYTPDSSNPAGHSMTAPRGYYLRPATAPSAANWVMLVGCSWDSTQVASEGPMHAMLAEDELVSGQCNVPGENTAVSPYVTYGYARTDSVKGMVRLYRSFYQDMSDFLSTTNKQAHDDNLTWYKDWPLAGQPHAGRALFVYPGTNG